jgi:hypothetical protein
VSARDSLRGAVSVLGIEHHCRAVGKELVIPLGGWSVLLVTSPTQGVERAFERVLSLCDGTVPMPMVSLGGCTELKGDIAIERWDRSAGVIQQGLGRDAKHRRAFSCPTLYYLHNLSHFILLVVYIFGCLPCLPC